MMLWKTHKEWHDNNIIQSQTQLGEELYKKLKFDHTAKWYMPKPESTLENETHKILRDFEIQTDHLIPARRPDLVIVNGKKKRTKRLVSFAFPAGQRVKTIENEKRDKYLDLARELKSYGTWRCQ